MPELVLNLPGRGHRGCPWLPTNRGSCAGSPSRCRRACCCGQTAVPARARAARRDPRSRPRGSSGTRADVLLVVGAAELDQFREFAVVTVNVGVVRHANRWGARWSRQHGSNEVMLKIHSNNGTSGKPNGLRRGPACAAPLTGGWCPGRDGRRAGVRPGQSGSGGTGRRDGRGIGRGGPTPPPFCRSPGTA